MLLLFPFFSGILDLLGAYFIGWRIVNSDNTYIKRERPTELGWPLRAGDISGYGLCLAVDRFPMVTAGKPGQFRVRDQNLLADPPGLELASCQEVIHGSDRHGKLPGGLSPVIEQSRRS
jgi:hypothetical protein